VISKNSCGKLHCRKGVNLFFFSNKIFFLSLAYFLSIGAQHPCHHQLYTKHSAPCVSAAWHTLNPQHGRRFRSEDVYSTPDTNTPSYPPPPSPPPAPALQRIETAIDCRSIPQKPLLTAAIQSVTCFTRIAPVFLADTTSNRVLQPAHAA